MIDYKELIERYLKIIEIKGDPHENYKYEAIQNFQDNWNIESDDFYSMFKKAFVKKGNLFYQNSWGFIEKAAKYFPDFTKSMFLNLYDENQDIEKRIKKFQAQSDIILVKIREKLNRTNLNAQQDERTISVYLTFRFPDTYIFYLYKYYKELSKEFGLPDVTNHNFHYLLSLLPEFKKKLHESEFFLEKYRNLYLAPSWNDENLMIQNILYVSYLNNLSDFKNNHTNSTENDYFDVDGISDLVDTDDENVRQDTFLKLEYLKERLEQETGIKFTSANHLKGFKKKSNIILEIRFQPLNLKDSSFEIVMGFGDEEEDVDYDSKTFFSLVVDSHNTRVAYSINDEYAATLSYEDFPDNWKSLLEFLKPKLEAIIKEVEILNISAPMVKITKIKAPVNQILYGPPGTGKTYDTINKAIAIANPEFDLKQERSVIKKEYERLIEEGQIVFTTFHQSMSYEDFVEGIKPQIEEDTDGRKTVLYDTEDGIFKKIVVQAKKIDKVDRSDIKWNEVDYYKMSLGGKNNPQEHSYCINNNLGGISWGGDNDLSELAAIKDFSTYKKEFLKRFPNVTVKSTFHIQASFTLFRMKEGDIVIATRGNQIIDAIGKVVGGYIFDDENPTSLQHFREIDWFAKDLNLSPEKFLKKNISQQSIYQFFNEDIKLDSFKELTTTDKKLPKNYVLIIDEINRGNISQIFGELITLLEEDKRLGYSEELQVLLPYSKDKFGVPSNLYIIGTMNTADRSVESLDTALRRRFSFTEMMPDLEVLSNIIIGGIAVKELLSTINKRVEVLLDRDHTIGHSYFINIKSIDDLRNAFKNNIIPLLQEYFYGDYEKIGLILGPEFFQEDEKYTKDIFAKFSTQNYPDAGNIMRLKIIDNEFDIIKALEVLLKKEVLTNG